MTARRAVVRALCGVAVAGSLVPRAASAQLDPLLFLKRAQPNVLILMDTSDRMQRDADEDYYDPNIYPKTGAAWETALGVSAATASATYRRKYVRLAHTSAAEKFESQSIVTVGDLEAGYTAFEAKTRISIARTAVTAAINQNLTAARWGLLRMRQSSPQVEAASSSGLSTMTSSAAQQATTDGSVAGKWKITRTNVSVANGSLNTVTAPLVSPSAANANTKILDILARDVRQSGALVPAGKDDHDSVDAPVDHLLEDARIEALKLVFDFQCRNTMAVLVTGGGEGDTAAGANPVSKAATFVLKLFDRRVPIHVIAVAPPAADVVQLKQIAATSGGVYTEISKAMIDAAAPGTAVPEFVRALNGAVQKTFIDPKIYNTAPSAGLPTGPSQEFQVTSPVVGTVNLDEARDITGAALLNTVIEHPVTGTRIPQRSNLMVTAGVELPGFLGRLRGFRVYTPVEDETKPIGYRFVQSGTRLWVATVPAAASRNIFTTLPDGTTIALHEDNAATLAPYLRTTAGEAPALISFIRSQPLGAVLDSTPAIMDPPSLDPPPDADYPAFADTHKQRRSLVWVGANDGMLHAIDARLGVEVWAYVPFNLLPKLRALRSGQSIDTFSYFVDSSPKVADVKIDGDWRTLLVVGQGPGGTFYNAFDVTLDGMASAVAPESDVVNDVLGYFADPGRVSQRWSFPRNSSFDHTFGEFGDLSSSASAVEKTVGETWSDPAIGQIGSGLGPHTVLTGSGFLKYSVQQQSNRNGAVGGNAFYLLNAATGDLIASKSVGSDGSAETVDDCRVVDDCETFKNALQADPVATGPHDSRYITKVYIGDLDGVIWRFDVGLDSANVPRFTTSAPTRLFEAGKAKALFASMATVAVGTQQYLFQGTGSDLLPTNGVSENYDLLVILDEGSKGKKTAGITLERVNEKKGEEKVTGFPAVAGDIVFFTTSTYKANVLCGSNVDAHLYAFTFIGGPAYDTNNDGKLTSPGKKGGGDDVVVRTTAGARATAPFVVDQHLVFAAGDNIEMFGDTQDFNNGVGQAGVRVLSWREVR